MDLSILAKVCADYLKKTAEDTNILVMDALSWQVYQNAKKVFEFDFRGSGGWEEFVYRIFDKEGADKLISLGLSLAKIADTNLVKEMLARFELKLIKSYNINSIKNNIDTPNYRKVEDELKRLDSDIKEKLWQLEDKVVAFLENNKNNAGKWDYIFDKLNRNPSEQFNIHFNQSLIQKNHSINKNWHYYFLICQPQKDYFEYEIIPFALDTINRSFVNTPIAGILNGIPVFELDTYKAIVASTDVTRILDWLDKNAGPVKFF